MILPTLGQNLVFLQESIESVINQKEIHKVLVCVDKNSKVKEQIVSSLKKYPSDKLKLIYGLKGGVSYTLNEGLKASTAPYIARQDDDDISEKNRFSTQISSLVNNKADMCFSSLSMFQEKDKLYTETIHDADEGFFWQESLILGSKLNHATMLANNFFKKENLFYPNVLAEDYNLWLKIVDKKSIYITSKYIYRYRQHQYQKTKNWDWKEVYKEVYLNWSRFFNNLNIPYNLNKKKLFFLIFGLSDKVIDFKDYFLLSLYLMNSLNKIKERPNLNYLNFIILRTSEILAKYNFQESHFNNYLIFLNKKYDIKLDFKLFLVASIRLSKLRSQYEQLGVVSHKIQLDNAQLLADNLKLNNKFIMRIYNRLTR